MKEQDNKSTTTNKIYIDEETAKKFTSLGQILKWARQEKERLEREEMFKEAGIDPAMANIKNPDEMIPEIDLDAKLAIRSVKNHHLKKWIIYPEDFGKSSWDIFMTG